MGILSEAHKLADKAREEKGEGERQERRLQTQRQAQLTKLWGRVFAEIQELDGTPTRSGKFRLTRTPNSRSAEIFAGSCLVARFIARIISGERDLSDDCRHIPYTEPTVEVHFLAPNSSQPYHFSVSEEERLPEFLQELSRHISRWL